MRLTTDQANFYLYELFQLMGSGVSVLMEKFFLDYSRQSPLFSHQLIWQSMVEKNTKPEEDRKYTQNAKKRIEADLMIDKLLGNFTTHEATVFNEIDSFLNEVTEISSKMEPSMSKEQKTEIIAEAVLDIKIPKFAYLPTNPHMRVVQILKKTGRPMQSAARCPFLLSFRCERIQDINSLLRDGGDNKHGLLLSSMDEGKTDVRIKNMPTGLSQINRPRNLIRKSKNSVSIHLSSSKTKSKLHNFDTLYDIADKMGTRRESIINKPKDNINTLILNGEESIMEQKEEEIADDDLITISCIFKTKDDLRNDAITLKIIALMKERYAYEKVPLYLKPYNTFSNRTGKELDLGGIIEVIPNTMSRDQIGKLSDCTLIEHFRNKYGPESSDMFRSAQENFIHSMAAYSMISYFVQIKDRHNANLLIDDSGNLTHIDFGFIFEISPAKNLGFENAEFKLLTDMVNVMGGRTDSDAFMYYKEMTIKAGLIGKDCFDYVVDLVRLNDVSGF